MKNLIDHLRAKRKLVLSLGLGLLLAVCGLAWVFWPESNAARMLTAPVVRADLEDTVLATGTVQALEEVSVGAQASGQLKSLKVDLGDEVRNGQLIAEIDSLTQQNQLRTAEANLVDLKAQTLAKRATLKQAELTFARQKQMLEHNATSRSDYESAEAALATARAELLELEARTKQAAISVDTAKVNLGYTKITAPISGKVVSIVTKAGQTVNASQSAPTIVKLARLDTVTVKAEISEADVIRVKPGQQVYFTILGDPEHRYEAVLRAVEPGPTSYSSDTSSSSSSSTSSSSSASTSSTAIYYNGLFDVKNPDGKLRISMTAEVHVVLAEARQTLTIPSSALDKPDANGMYRVKVLAADGKVELRDIKLGINNRVNAQVLEGLREGEQVVIGEEGAASAAGSGNGNPHRPPPGMM